MVGGRNREVRILGRRVTGRGASAIFVLTIAAVACCLAVVFVLRGLEMSRLGREIAQIRLDQTAALEDKEALHGRLALRDDPQTIEDEARERLGLVKPGEEKVIFGGEG